MALHGYCDCLVADVCGAPLVFVLEGHWVTSRWRNFQESAYSVPSNVRFCKHVGRHELMNCLSVRTSAHPPAHDVRTMFGAGKCTGSRSEAEL